MLPQPSRPVRRARSGGYGAQARAGCDAVALPGGGPARSGGGGATGNLEGSTQSFGKSTTHVAPAT